MASLEIALCESLRLASSDWTAKDDAVIAATAAASAAASAPPSTSDPDSNTEAISNSNLSHGHNSHNNELSDEEWLSVESFGNDGATVRVGTDASLNTALLSCMFHSIYFLLLRTHSYSFIFSSSPPSLSLSFDKGNGPVIS
jgi:hypothetical protein